MDGRGRAPQSMVGAGRVKGHSIWKTPVAREDLDLTGTALLELKARLLSGNNVLTNALSLDQVNNVDRKQGSHWRKG